MRGGDDEHLGGGNLLAQAHGDVAGAGWQVEQQVVEISPVHVGQQLGEGAVEDRATPGDDIVLVGLHHADADRLDAHGGHRQEQVVQRGGVGVTCTEHVGNRVAVDVGVQQTDRSAQSSQGQGQVDGHRRLADAALAGGHGNDLGGVARLGERDGGFWGATTKLLTHGGALLVGHGPELDVGTTHSVDGGGGFGDVLTQGVLEWTSRNRQENANVGAAVVVDGYLVNHAEVGDGSPDLRILYTRQRLMDRWDKRVFGAHMHCLHT